MKSKDLSSWEICNYVYVTLADDDMHNLKNGKHDYSHGQWASSLRYKDGTYYVFFGSASINKSYLCKTNDIENGTFEINVINTYYHDASLLLDDDGRNYLIYGVGTIKIKELNYEMTDFIPFAEEYPLFSTGLSGLAGEGSKILKINNYYYIFIIAWPSGEIRQELCFRSKELLGKYESKIILKSGIGTYSAGAAQGAIVDTPDGKWYGYVFQDHGGVGRVPVLTPLTWVDDWPIMGVDNKVPITMELDTVGAGTHLAENDDFNNEKLSLLWQWNHNPDNNSFSLSEKKGFLRLKNNNIATNLLNARNTLTVRTEGPKCSGYIKVDTTNMLVGDFTGLAAFQFNYGKVGVYVDDSGNKKIYMAKNGGYSSNTQIVDSYDKIVEEVELKQDFAFLKVDFYFNDVESNFNVLNNIDKVNFYYSLDEKNWVKIGEEITMTYDLKMFIGYKFGIYSYPTKNIGIYIDVDFFRYHRSVWN